LKRVAIAGFQHETNTFGTTLADFHEFETADAWPPLLMGDEVISGSRGINLPITGFVEASEDLELVPVLWCSAEPSSYVTDEAFERIAGMIVERIKQAGPLDGIFLDLHGAMVTQSYRDGEGELLKRLRGALGEDVPIAISLDFHANITPRMIHHASAMTIYRTYPHLDMAETGGRANAMLRQLMAGGVTGKAWRQAPFLVPVQGQYTGAEPCASLYGGLNKFADDTGIIGADIAMGFSAADIYDAGPSVVVYADDQEHADKVADELFGRLLEAEKDFDTSMLSATDAVREAMAANTDAGPVVLADVQDNPGAGAPSDTTGILRALVEGRAQGAVVGLLNDPAAADAAHAAGLGAEIELDLGGKAGLADQPPYKARFVVEHLADGEMTFTGAMYRGAVGMLGKVALLRVVDVNADVRVAVGSQRCQCLDLAMFRHAGVEPTEQRILVVKSSVHFRADFEPIASRVLVVDSPGVNRARLSADQYEHLRPGVRFL